jgi:ferrous iron transport protein B
MFLIGTSAGIWSSLQGVLILLILILLGIIMTFLVSNILSKTILKGKTSSFILELPPYRKPQIGSIIVRSLLDRTLFVLGRAVSVAAPVGIIIWLFSNINISGYSILFYIANFLDPFAQLMGLDGYILTAFILGIPANEIVLPIILMSYLSTGSLVNIESAFAIGEILKQNGWTLLTGINVMLFTLLHFPCGTTLMSIKKESGSTKWALLAFALPTVCGIVVCMITTGIWNFIT